MDPLIRGLWLTPGLLTTNVANDQSHDHPSNWWSPIKIVKLPITTKSSWIFPIKNIKTSISSVPNDVPWICPKLHGSTMRKTPARDLLGFCPVTKRRPLGTCPGSQTCWSLPGHKKKPRETNRKGEFELRYEKKHGKIRKVVGQWSINGPCSPMFQSYVTKCHKYWNSMGDWRLWNGVSTVLLCEKTYPLQGQPQFCGAHVHRRNSCFNVLKWGWKKVNMQHSIP